MRSLALVLIAAASGCTFEHTYESAMDPLEPDLTMPLAVQIHDREAWSLEYDGTVRAVSLDTGDARIVIPAARVVAPNELVVEPEAFDLAVTDDAVYWTNRGVLSRANLDGSGATALFTSQKYIYDLAVSAGTVCWSGGERAACLRPGSSTPIAFPADPKRTRSVATDGTTVYWGEEIDPDDRSTPGAIHSAPIAGGAATTLAPVSGAPLKMVLADRLYWLDDGSCTGDGLCYSDHNAGIGSVDLATRESRTDLGGFSRVYGFAVAGDHIFVNADLNLWDKTPTKPRDQVDQLVSCYDLAADAKDIVCASLGPDRGSLARLSR